MKLQKNIEYITDKTVKLSKLAFPLIDLARKTKGKMRKIGGLYKKNVDFHYRIDSNMMYKIIYIYNLIINTNESIKDVEFIPKDHWKYKRGKEVPRGARFYIKVRQKKMIRQGESMFFSLKEFFNRLIEDRVEVNFLNSKMETPNIFKEMAKRFKKYMNVPDYKKVIFKKKNWSWRDKEIEGGELINEMKIDSRYISNNKRIILKFVIGEYQHDYWNSFGNESKIIVKIGKDINNPKVDVGGAINSNLFQNFEKESIDKRYKEIKQELKERLRNAKEFHQVLDQCEFMFSSDNVF